MRAKVVKVDECGLKFDNGLLLYSDHLSDCCEWHELYFKDLELKDFDGLEFDLSNEKFFNKIPDYGIELVPLKGHTVKIAGHGSNNGYYSTELTLVIKGSGYFVEYDITECQDIDD